MKWRTNESMAAYHKVVMAVTDETPAAQSLLKMSSKSLRFWPHGFVIAAAALAFLGAAIGGWVSLTFLLVAAILSPVVAWAGWLVLVILFYAGRLPGVAPAMAALRETWEITDYTDPQWEEIAGLIDSEGVAATLERAGYQIS